MKSINEKLEVMRGWLEGKAVQVKRNDSFDWCDIGTQPLWAWDVADYRLRPEIRRVVPLEPADLPALFWLKQSGNGLLRLAVGISSNTVRVVCNVGIEDISFHDLMRLGWEYSPDRKSWKPMWKVVL